MLKTYRIIPLVFILFLFGFTLFTVSPVFAWDPSMGMRHPDRPCMKVNSCGPDKRSPAQIASDPWDNGGTLMPTLQLQPPKRGGPPPPSGGEGTERIQLETRLDEVAELDARIAESESQVATLTTTNAQLEEQLRSASAAAEPLNAKIAELKTENATLRELQGAPADPSGGEFADRSRITELKVAGCKGEERLGECVRYVRSRVSTVCKDITEKLRISAGWCRMSHK